jgi:hypothetical protein
MAAETRNGSSLAYSKSYRWRNTPASAWGTKTYSLTNSFGMSTINHGPGPYSGKSDQGGPFLLNKSSWKVAPVRLVSSIFDGEVIAGKPATYTFSSKPIPANTTQMNTFGTGAIAKVGPTNPAFQGATFLGELREGAPRAVGTSLFRERARVLRNAGNEYLNVEFGWLPFKSDLEHFCHAVKDSHRILKQYVKDSDNKIRRRYYEPVTEVNRSTSFTNGIALPADAGIFCRGTVDEYTLRKKWFSGAFRYHIPAGNSVRERFIRYESEANRLLGTRVTPEVVWNLSPWSWAADWFADTGDVVHNISVLGHDGLVMQYGYAMETTLHRYDIMNVVGAVSCYTSFEEKTLFRIPASPYGFGLTWSGFTPTRLAVLAALGVSRG